MAVEVITKEDLQQFRFDLLNDLKQLLKSLLAGQQKKWLKSDEVKKLLKVSPCTLQTLRINGTLQYTKLGGIIYYDNGHIEKLMKANLRVATA